MSEIVIPLRTGRGLNDRPGHFYARGKKVKRERTAVAWSLVALLPRERPSLPCVVTLTRLAPSNGLDDDNLAGALKAVRDQVAVWLGVDDRRRELVRYRYEQERTKDWGVRVQFEEIK